MKKLLTLIGTAFLAFATLTACGSSGSGGDSDGDGGQNGDAQGESLPYSLTEASNKLVELGNTQGFEITYTGTTSEEPDGASFTIGLKNNVLWMAEAIAYKKDANGHILIYAYNDETHQYEGGYDMSSLNSSLSSFDALVVDVTAAFYYAYNPSGFTYQNKKATTFLGRSATEYTASFTGNGVSVNYSVVIDNVTGITLKFKGSGSTIQGDFGFAEMEISSFLIGDQVTVPTLVNEGGAVTPGGEGGEGGNTQPGGTAEPGGTTEPGEGSDPGTDPGTNPQPDDLSRYLVTDAQYATYVSHKAYALATANVTVNGVFKNDYNTDHSEQYHSIIKNASGVYSMEFVYPSSTTAVVYVPDAEHDGYYYSYRQVDGEWEKSQQPAQVSPMILEGDMGLDVASLISLSQLNEPAFLSSPYYYKETLNVTDGDYTRTLTRVRMYFDNGQLVKFMYTENGTAKEYTYSAFGTTRVQIPDVQDNTPVKHNEYIANKQFAYQRTDMDGYTGSLVTEEELATMQASVYKFFSDGTYELDITQSNKLYVDIGTYELMVKPNSNIAELKLRQTDEYFDGAATNEKNGGNRTLQYDVTNQLVKVIHGITSSNGTHYDVAHIYAKGNETPVKYEIPVVASKWPAADIAQKLAKLGFTNVIPEINNASAMVEAASVEIADGSLHITCEFTNAADALSAYYSYLTALYNGDYNYDWTNCDSENGIYAFLSRDNKMSLIVTYADGSSIVNIYAKEPLGSQYPSQAIAAWLEDHSVTDRIPEFKCNNASYSFQDGVLYITAPESADKAAIIASFVDTLTTQLNYTVETVAATTVYVSPNRNVGIAFNSYDSMIMVVFGDSSQLPSPASNTYPSTEIGEFFTAKTITDELPDLSIDGAEYVFYDCKEDGEWSNQIAFSLQLSASANVSEVISNYETLLTGFTYDDSEGLYISPNKQFAVELYVDESIYFIGITIYVYEEPEPVTLSFTVSGADTQFGQRVYLVGDFCNWDPSDANAIAFDYDEAEQVWVAEMDAVIGTEIHCKLVIASYDDPANGEVIWEVTGYDNERVLEVPDSDAFIDFDWGNY